jgi:hypothetical protein
MVNPDEVYEIEDYSAQTLQAQIERLLVGNTPEQLIYRECELDEIWRLLDLDITSLRATGGSADELARLQRLRDIVMQAHDLVGVDGKPAAAAERLRELIA